MSNTTPHEIPADVIAAAEKVACYFRENNISRWELGDLAARDHYRSVIATARLCTQYQTNVSHPQLARHLDELDFLVNA